MVLLELITTVESGKSPVDPEHGLLDRLVGLLAVLQDAVADLRREGPVFHEDVRVRVDIPGLERQDQGLVVIKIGAGAGARERPNIGESCGQGPPFGVGL